MIDKVKMWVLIHCYRTLMDRAAVIHYRRQMGSPLDSALRRYEIAREVYDIHCHDASSWERHALYEYAEGGDE